MPLSPFSGRYNTRVAIECAELLKKPVFPFGTIDGAARDAWSKLRSDELRFLGDEGLEPSEMAQRLVDAIRHRVASRYFVSYAWGDSTPEGRAREEVVDRLCEAAEKRGVTILRDKQVIRLGESISKFMHRLSRADRVFIVLSDKYLKSPYCMYELAGVWRYCQQDAAEFLRRIRVFTLDDAKIWSPKQRALRAVYWRNESEELEAIVKQHGFDVLGGKDYERYRLMKEFAHQIGPILATVTDILQPRTFEELERYGFADDQELDGKSSRSSGDE